MNFSTEADSPKLTTPTRSFSDMVSGDKGLPKSSDFRGKEPDLDFQQKLSTKASQISRDVQQKVRANPLTFIGAAVVVTGLVSYAIFKRRL